MTVEKDTKAEVSAEKKKQGWLESQLSDKLMLSPPSKPIKSLTRAEDASLQSPPPTKIQGRWIENTPTEKSPGDRQSFSSPSAYDVSVIRLRFSKDATKSAVTNNISDVTSPTISESPSESGDVPRKMEKGYKIKAIWNNTPEFGKDTSDGHSTNHPSKIKRDIDISGLISHFTPKKENKTRDDRKNSSQVEKRTKPPTLLKNVRAPTLNSDLDKFQPRVMAKTKDEVKFLSNAMKDSTILKNNKFESKLVSVMDEVYLKGGEILSTQGETKAKDDKYYIIQQGAIQFEVNGEIVETAGRGACFGEDRLLYRYSNKATIVASEDSKLFRLDQQAYRSVMQQEGKKSNLLQERIHPVKRISPGKTLAGDWDLSGPEIYQQQEASRNFVQKGAPSIDDLEMIRLLGEGQFGEVWLVSATVPPKSPEGEATKQFFALKKQYTIPDEVRNDPESAIRQEIQVMESLRHPFIANLVHVYESSDSIDMLLGLIKGEDLWSKVHRQDDKGTWFQGISEGVAKFYTCILVDTLAFLHKRNYVFRDFKLENIMINEDGYPILIDFGYAKQIPEGEKTFTFCGTPNYVAPEVIQLEGHNHAVDYWALGVVIYEMISGENPFFYDGMEQLDLYQTIINEPPYPLDKTKYNADVIDLCNKLLEKDQGKRLGTTCSDDILEHAWLSSMPDLKEFRTKQVHPPPLTNEGDAKDGPASINKASSSTITTESDYVSKALALEGEEEGGEEDSQSSLPQSEVFHSNDKDDIFPGHSSEMIVGRYSKTQISSKSLSNLETEDMAITKKKYLPKSNAPKEHHWLGDDVDVNSDQIESSPELPPMPVKRLSSKEVKTKYRYRAYHKKRMSADQNNSSESRRAFLKGLMLEDDDL